MYHAYKKGSHTIEATEWAYESIYRAQGYRPLCHVTEVEENPPSTISEAGDMDESARGGTGSSGETKTAKRSRKSE